MVQLPTWGDDVEVKRSSSSRPLLWVAIPAGILILILHLVSSDADSIDLRLPSPSDWDFEAVKSTLGVPSKKPCVDAYSRPGYIWYGNKPQDVRWIPYKTAESLLPENSTAANLNPETNLSVLSESSLPADPTPHVRASNLFASLENQRAQLPALEFLKNRHIAVLGSSLDREAVRMFCARHPGSDGMQEQHHRYIWCNFPSHNFTISYWHHFGLHQSNWMMGDDRRDAGTTIEQRLERVFVPMAERLGKPDLLIFTSGLWDLKYLHARHKQLDSHVQAHIHSPLHPNELMWHRSRLAEIIELLRQTFPDAFLMYRTTTVPRKDDRTEKGDEEPISVFQLNESARALMRLLKVPIFNWSDLARGNNERKDVYHYKTDSHPNWLYGEMVLYHLQQVLDEQQDTSCWLDR